MDGARRESGADVAAADRAVRPDGRDTDLDDLRALVLIWVILLHCLYWFGLVGVRWNVVKSLFLFEMPVLFFVAGASNAVGRARPVGAFYASRLTRILVPYWVYAAACVALEAWTAPGPPRSLDYRWIVPTEAPRSPLGPLTWHLWFVPIYLSVMALFPWLRMVFNRLSSWRRAAPLAALALVLLAFDDFGIRREFPRNTVFYAFWAYLGLYYPTWRARPWSRGAVLAVGGGAYVVLWRLLSHGVYQPDFQWNKFPANGAFFLLCAGHFGLLALAAPWIRAVARRPAVRLLTAPYRSYGYTIYLFHPFGFHAVMTGFGHWPAARLWAEANPTATIALVASALVVAVPVLAWPFSVVERMRFAPRSSRSAVVPGRLDAPHTTEVRPAPAHCWARLPFLRHDRTP